MKWARHMVRMKDERLPKRSKTKKHDGKQKTRKTTAKMGGLCEERSFESQRRKKSGEKRPTTGTNGNKLQK